ncbi:MAG: M42 family metallopeptidase [Candidatus Hodarchaeales archaeon]|jgi:endoglucanase
MSNKQLIERQKKLSEIIGVSGYEEKVREFIQKELEELDLDLKVDGLGNLLGIRKTQQSGGKRVLLDAHMDEIGFMVNHVYDDGYLGFAPIGGWDNRMLTGSRIIMETAKGNHYGTISSKPPHITTVKERERAPKAHELFVDIGYTSAEDAAEVGVRIGTVFTLDGTFIELFGGILLGKAFDDRTGCNIIVQVLKELEGQELKHEIMFNFSVQEEVGTRGARTGAYTLNPDLALALENTVAADMPGVPKNRMPTTFNGGPAISVADRSVLCSPWIVELLEKAAKTAGITYQFKKPVFGGTDAGAISQVRGGVPVGVLSVPSKYIHSPNTMIRVEDISNTVKIVKTFVQLL